MSKKKEKKGEVNLSLSKKKTKRKEKCVLRDLGCRNLFPVPFFFVSTQKKKFLFHIRLFQLLGFFALNKIYFALKTRPAQAGFMIVTQVRLG